PARRSTVGLSAAPRHGRAIPSLPFHPSSYLGHRRPRAVENLLLGPLPLRLFQRPCGRILHRSETNRMCRVCVERARAEHFIESKSLLSSLIGVGDPEPPVACQPPPGHWHCGIAEQAISILTNQGKLRDFNGRTALSSF